MPNLQGNRQRPQSRQVVVKSVAITGKGEEMTRLEEIRKRDWRHDVGVYRADCEWLLERVDELAEELRCACSKINAEVWCHPEECQDCDLNKALSKLEE